MNERLPQRIKVIKPIDVKRPPSPEPLGYQEEIVLNDALSRVSISLRIINDKDLAQNYYMRLRQYLAEFEKAWGLGDKY
jgi:hypothetical protein